MVMQKYMLLYRCILPLHFLKYTRCTSREQRITAHVKSTAALCKKDSLFLTENTHD
jgi:predicted SpoU family rRNA methylase